jgi:cation transport protein ChaC
MKLAMTDFWVFGYGSLMWRPGFEVIAAVPATMSGMHRSLCVYSWVHRGTRHRPGLVFGLDAGGSCKGMAFRVAGETRENVLTYLRQRELVTNVYHEVERIIKLEDGERVEAIAYVVDRKHNQYAGNLSLDELVKNVHGAVGQSGKNEDYIFSTVLHLRELAIHDARLEQLVERLNKIKGNS